MAVVRLAPHAGGHTRDELVQQLDMAREDLELARGFAADLARRRPTRR